MDMAGVEGGTPAFVLASSSPRRVTLLRMLGLPFVQDAPRVEQPLPPQFVDPVAWTETQALAKARDVAERWPGALVIGADTVVVVDDRLLGKPRHRADAVRMLSLLGGRDHRVVTGIALVDGGTGRTATGHSTTRVWMRPLDAATIEAYVETGEPMDKAGAYGIQGKGAILVQRIEGCYFNVVGLPLNLLADLLARFGVHWWTWSRPEVRP